MCILLMLVDWQPEIIVEMINIFNVAIKYRKVLFMNVLHFACLQKLSETAASPAGYVIESVCPGCFA